jgi:hypothetical protein
MSRKIYNRLRFMAVSWLDESTLGLRGWVAVGWLRSLASLRMTIQEESQGVLGRARRTFMPRG